MPRKQVTALKFRTSGRTRMCVRRWARALPLTVTVTAVAALCSAVSAPYKDGAPAGTTGGFGDATCHSCHFDQSLNRPEGRLTVSGIPDSYIPDSIYSINVSVARPDLGRAGFALAARASETESAGEFETADGRTKIASAAALRSYVTHTEFGSSIQADSTTWSLQWTAPREPVDTVFFNLAANAANGDDSEFGDWIYVHESTSIPNLTRTHDN